MPESKNHRDDDTAAVGRHDADGVEGELIDVPEELADLDDPDDGDTDDTRGAAATQRGKSKAGKTGKPGKTVKPPKVKKAEKARKSAPPRRMPKQRRWVAPVMLTCWVLGLAWMVVFYVAGTEIPFMRDLNNWNLLIGMALIAVGFIVSTQWV